MSSLNPNQKLVATASIRPAFLSASMICHPSRLAAARRLGWQIIDADKNAGRIEAVATSFWFGFKDDIVIRLRHQNSGCRVDIRSESHVGVSDLGKNAERIRRFLRAMKE